MRGQEDTGTEGTLCKKQRGRLSNDGTLLMSEQCRATDGRRMLAGLLSASHLMPLELLPAKTASHAAVVGFGQVLIYLADLQRDVLRLMTGKGLDAGQGVVGEEDDTGRLRKYRRNGTPLRRRGGRLEGSPTPWGPGTPPPRRGGPSDPTASRPPLRNIPASAGRTSS